MKGREQPSEYYDKAFQQEKYNCHYTDSPDYGLWEKVIKHLNYHENILELGCGTGQFAELLKDSGFYRYFGCDFSDEAVTKASKRVGFYFALHDIREKFTMSYDTIVCLETLEHIEDDLQVIKNLLPRTKFVGSVPKTQDPAHVRVFRFKSDITERYGELIDIKKIQSHKMKFIFTGTVI